MQSYHRRGVAMQSYHRWGVAMQSYHRRGVAMQSIIGGTLLCGAAVMVCYVMQC